MVAAMLKGRCFQSLSLSMQNAALKFKVASVFYECIRSHAQFAGQPIRVYVFIAKGILKE